MPPAAPCLLRLLRLLWLLQLVQLMLVLLLVLLVLLVPMAAGTASIASLGGGAARALLCKGRARVQGPGLLGVLGSSLFLLVQGWGCARALRAR